jgi:hypothetical protein
MLVLSWVKLAFWPCKAAVHKKVKKDRPLKVQIIVTSFGISSPEPYSQVQPRGKSNLKEALIHEGKDARRTVAYWANVL